MVVIVLLRLHSFMRLTVPEVATFQVRQTLIYTQYNVLIASWESLIHDVLRTTSKGLFYPFFERSPFIATQHEYPDLYLCI
jgi:hypothetical protein